MTKNIEVYGRSTFSHPTGSVNCRRFRIHSKAVVVTTKLHASRPNHYLLHIYEEYLRYRNLYPTYSVEKIISGWKTKSAHRYCDVPGPFLAVTDTDQRFVGTVHNNNDNLMASRRRSWRSYFGTFRRDPNRLQKVRCRLTDLVCWLSD
jgi:hypothetical protein